MPILSVVGRKSWSQRLMVLFLYIVLTLLGATMVIPFLITLTNANSNNFDYDRFAVIPRSLWSKEDQFFKGLVHFINRYPNWFVVLQDNFPEAPATWTSWRAIGLDSRRTDSLAATYLQAPPDTQIHRAQQSADYAEFAASYPLDDSLVTFTDEVAADFIALRYQRAWAEANPEAARTATSDERAAAGLALLSQTWEVPIRSFVSIRFETELRVPMGQQSWVPVVSPKQEDFRRLQHAIRAGFGTPGIPAKWTRFLQDKGFSSEQARIATPLPEDASPELRRLWVEFSQKEAPASPAMPFPMRMFWHDYFGSDQVREILSLGDNERFDVARYNAMAGTHYASLRETPFPLPAGMDQLKPLWDKFVAERYPLRLVSLTVTPAMEQQFQQFVQQAFVDLSKANSLLKTNATAWSDFRLSPTLPATSNLRDVWMNFVKTLPLDQRQLHSSEGTYQAFLIQKYGTLDKINEVYGWKLQRLEEAFPPFAQAYAVTFEKNSAAFAWAPFLRNYGTMLKFLFSQSNALPVTLWLIILSIFVTLTVNPIAGYALSRFNLKGKDKIILFCLATSAFPAMVSAIPGYLLMRDLGLLNTFLALVLPGAASGMSIFILKGFFDSLPQELYEAATIDGAREWQIFFFVTLPMVKPILAINALHAFLGAYGGWEWALIICQDQKMWTLSVWLYQASQWWAQSPWIATSGFVLASIPTMIVFFFCQNIILRGIIVPSMK